MNHPKMVAKTSINQRVGAQTQRGHDPKYHRGHSLKEDHSEGFIEVVSSAGDAD